MRKELVKKRCCAALNAIMDYRKITMAQLAKGTGISYRSIENYCNGKNDISCSKAYNVVEIEYYLDVDGRILTGSRSIDDFYNAESERLDREEKKIREDEMKGRGNVNPSEIPLHWVMGCDSPDGSITLTVQEIESQRDSLQRMLRYYQAFMEKTTQNDEQ